ncbi:ECF-type sigma factor [Veillonella sp.]|jgi:predicted DNA-binding protein YlxM (UPF0122 family)|uniref:ECF-type sigma factor n=1 Tax=Veillonella sp. TaxID=1926307 RepID=UPI00206D3EAF|nr:ECF-type sigma factor [Veillonella sp.]DAT46104.1 MAG TPA: ECF sigma factor [Caudoviricetes sp.]
MDKNRKLARTWLINSSRADFEDIIYKSKITPRQQKIIEFRILKNFEITKIANLLNLSEETIQRDIKNSYNLISSALIKYKLI